MKKIIFLLITLTLFSIDIYSAPLDATIKKGKTGLLIIDAQKWYIPGHAESLYKLWGITGYDREADELIGAMDSVLTWANQKKLPVFITYEGIDTGRYDLPNELKTKLDSSKTKHFVKTYFAATKHDEFNAMIENSGITNWLIIGAETDVCVYQTARELLKKNMEVTLVKEAIYSGRNNTEVSLNNLLAFGANIVHVSDLYNGSKLFLNSIKKVDKDISYENIVITIISDQTINVELNDSANFKRLEYLKKFAQITGIPVEEINKSSTITSSNKTRLLAGNLTNEYYKKIQTQTKDSLVIISDCIINIPYSKQSKEWHKETLKMIFYELVATVSLFPTPIDQLHGWQKELMKALKEGTLDYVDSSQNL